jgi:hypothetical protein
MGTRWCTRRTTAYMRRKTPSRGRAGSGLESLERGPYVEMRGARGPEMERAVRERIVRANGPAHEASR